MVEAPVSAWLERHRWRQEFVIHPRFNSDDMGKTTMNE